MVDRDTVDQIKQQLDLVAVLSRYITLTPSGKNYKGRCPFHKDDTPSLVVSPERGLWHCFGCNEGGDLLAFVMKIERLTFPEALERLAAEAGVSLPSRGSHGSKRAESQAILTAAKALFSEQLRDHHDAEEAREYLRSRGFDKESWTRFGLGYSLAKWDGLKAKLAGKFTAKQLLAAGLLSESKGRTYDRFRGRVMFPIHNISGVPVAFGGRALDGEPKYLNSPATAGFDKGHHLYGLDWAREAIQASGTAILVEGYTDVLSLHIAGIVEATGGMGTALTERQAQLLARFAGRVILVYDRDSAGDAAALRGMGILRNTGVDVHVARLPIGEDPDSCVRKSGADAFRMSLEQAVSFQDFFVEALGARFEIRTSRGKSAALEESKNVFKTLTSIPIREELATRIAELLGLSRDDVRRELDPRSVQRTTVRSSVPHEATWQPATVLLALVLRSRVPWSRIDDLVSSAVFPPSLRPLAEALSDSAGGEIQSSSDMIAQLPSEAAPTASELVLRPLPFDEENSKQVEKAVRDALARMVEAPAVERKLGELRQQMADCVASGDHEQLDRLQHRYSVLIVERNRMAKGGKA